MKLPADPAGTINGVLSDLAEVAERLPVPVDRSEHVARLLDRLAEEIAEAAAMLRAGDSRVRLDTGGWISGPCVDPGVSPG